MNAFNFRSLSFFLVLMVMIVLSGSAVAAQPYYGPGGMSPEKQEIARKLYEDFYKNTEAASRELVSKRHELSAQMHSQNPDEKKIQALIGAISELRTKLYSARINLNSKLVQEGITSEQYGYGPGMRYGFGACGGSCGGFTRGGGGGCGYGPGMGRGRGMGMGRGYGPGPGYGPGAGGGAASCCPPDGAGPGMGPGYGGPGMGPGMRGGW